MLWTCGSPSLFFRGTLFPSDCCFLNSKQVVSYYGDEASALQNVCPLSIPTHVLWDPLLGRVNPKSISKTNCAPYDASGADAPPKSNRPLASQSSVLATPATDDYGQHAFKQTWVCLDALFPRHPKKCVCLRQLPKAILHTAQTKRRGKRTYNLNIQPKPKENEMEREHTT